MFSKIDKKVLIFLIVVLIIIAVIGFWALKYLLNESNINIENSIGGLNTENQEPDSQNNNQGDLPDVQIEGVGVDGTESVQQGFSVCLDQCGDGVCQPAGTTCPDNLNCPCAETLEDCPSDCQ